MKRFCTWIVVSSFVWLSPDLGALPRAGSPDEAPSRRDSRATQVPRATQDPWATSPAPAPRCEVPSTPVVHSTPEFPEPPVHIAIGGQRAVIDPQTGRLLVPRRPTLELPRQRLDSFRVPHATLHPQELPGGGWKLGLQGRMLTPIFATTGPDGRPAPTHTWESVDEARR